MIRWIYATWIIPGVLQSWQLRRRRPRSPYRPVGHVKRHRPARAGLGVQLFDQSVDAGSPYLVRATLQAGEQRILDAFQAGRDDIAAVCGQMRGTVTLGTALSHRAT